MSYNVGQTRTVLGCTRDTWALNGTKLKIPNAAWHSGARGTSTCTVVAVTTAPDAPIIVLSSDGFHYPISAELTLSSAPHAMRVKLRKSSTHSSTPRPLLPTPAAPLSSFKRKRGPA